MPTVNRSEQPPRPHTSSLGEASVAIIVLGGCFRHYGESASDIHNVLSGFSPSNVRIFEITCNAGELADCLYGHKAAIIIDSTSNGTASGTVSLMNLSAVLDASARFQIRSTHGSYIKDELNRAEQFGQMPERVVLFGLELKPEGEYEILASPEKEVCQHLPRNLCLLMGSVINALNYAA